MIYPIVRYPRSSGDGMRIMKNLCDTVYHAHTDVIPTLYKYFLHTAIVISLLLVLVYARGSALAKFGFAFS